MEIFQPPVAVLLVIGGMVMLGFGAGWLVDGASRLALRLGVRPMIVGLTVVGFGTSMPEFSVSVLAAARGSGGLSLGNAVGSNIMNLLLVLGAAAVVAPMAIVGSRRALARDLGFGIVPGILLIIACWNGRISRPIALVLIAVFLVFLATCIGAARGERREVAVKPQSPLRHLALLTVGIVVVVVGADLMVRGGVSLAHSIGVSDAVIGLTVVAFGTSLPELATSVAAALKGEAEISVGNVLGSNVFNLGLIVGTAFAVRPGPVPPFVIHQDVPFLILVSLIVGLLFLRKARTGRREGAALLALFAAYMIFIAIRGG